MLAFQRLIPVALLATTLTTATSSGAAPGEKFPETKTRLLKTREIGRMAPDARQYAINEIFARHGLLFGDMKLRKQFLPFKWYQPEPGQTTDETRKLFNSYERRNVERLANAREQENVEAAVYKSPYKPGSQGLAGERYPETRLDKIDVSNVAAMTDAQINFAINEIYARHGLVFGDMNLRKHFLGLGWYKPKPDLSGAEVERTFSRLETENADNLAFVRAARQDENHGA